MRRAACIFGLTTALALLILSTAAEPGQAGEKAKTKLLAQRGQQWFERVWTADDSQAKGDGLGPLFNERSCIACHFQGGIGGSGPNVNNAVVLSVVVPMDSNVEQIRRYLAKRHPSFGENTALVLHRYNNNAAAYAAFSETLFGMSGLRAEDPIRQAMLALSPADGEEAMPIKTLTIDNWKFKLSERNTTPLFGLGLLETIPVWEIRRGAARQREENPLVVGQYVGRFGWRGQIDTLRDFVRGACANELGLQVAMHSQASDPTGSDDDRSKTPTDDLTEQQCDEMTAFVAHLPPPRELQPTDVRELKKIKLGQSLFIQTGCAVCHRPTLGRVTGLYSDLLVHNMGTRLSDPLQAPTSALIPGSVTNTSAMYYGTVTTTTATLNRESTYGREQLWKTPPLWGLRDSAPYLHDGRAATVHDAILEHGGEATDSVEAYKALSTANRQALLAFLDTLVAPDPASLPKRVTPEAAPSVGAR